MKLSGLIIFGITCSLVENIKISQFTANVYKELAKEYPETFMVCPLSVKIIFALIQKGAAGKTLEEIAQVLNFPQKFKAFGNYIRWLLAHLQGNKNYVLKSVNKMYVSDIVPINKQYKRKAINIFNVEIQKINFGNPTQAAKDINKWVERYTNNKIKALVEPEFFEGETIMVLINAMHFHGTWATKFPKELTKQRLFYGNNGKNNVDMMHLESRFNYYKSDVLRATFLEMPYKGADVTMTIILPDKFTKISFLEDRMSEVLLPLNYDSIRVSVFIPKFKITSEVDFIPILRKLGIRQAFDNADFSGITDFPSRISSVVQKTFIEVNEEGTTASAATVAVLQSRNGGRLFLADRPFIFYLKSKVGVLFIGRYTGK